MIDITDFTYTPTTEEIGEFIRNDLFKELCGQLDAKYKVLCKIEFSKCTWEYGWNVKFKKAGKTLCTVYPREGYFTAMVVVSGKEKEQVEEILPELSPILQQIYHSTEEGNGQRWLMIDLEDTDAVYEDVLKLIDIRRKSK